jgi:hypothetical protein
MRGHSLCIHLQRDPAIGLPKELLDNLHIFLMRLQQCAEGMTEGVPTASLAGGREFEPVTPAKVQTTR